MLENFLSYASSEQFSLDGTGALCVQCLNSLFKSIVEFSCITQCKKKCVFWLPPPLQKIAPRTVNNIDMTHSLTSNKDEKGTRSDTAGQKLFSPCQNINTVSQTLHSERSFLKALFSATNNKVCLWTKGQNKLCFSKCTCTCGQGVS